MSDGCEGTCSTCGELCASAERKERKAASATLEDEVKRLTLEVANERLESAWVRVQLSDERQKLERMEAARDRLEALLADSMKHVLDGVVLWRGSVTDLIGDVLHALRARASSG